MTFIFKTTTTMKEYNARKWWIDSGIVRENYKWSTQYIDLWVTVLTVIDTIFE